MLSVLGSGRWTGRRLLVVLAVLLAAGLAVRGFRSLAAERFEPGRGAAWIWSAGARDAAEGATFWAVTDIELASAPEAATLRIQADEEYAAFVNAQLVGSGAWYPGAGLDGYDIAPLLAEGRNRIAVQLTSRRGAGGLLAFVATVPGAEPLARTGADWRIFSNATGVVRGTRELEGGEPALVWQVPPTGAWGSPSLGPVRPSFDQLLASHPARWPVEVRETTASRFEGGPQRRAVLFDLGETVTGYLVFSGLQRARDRLEYELDPDSPGGSTKGEAMLTEEQRTWCSAEVHTFRYVRIWGGLPGRFRLAAVPVPEELAKQDRERQERRRRGVFGLPVPPGVRPSGISGAAAQNVFRRVLERQARRLGGKDLELLLGLLRAPASQLRNLLERAGGADQLEDLVGRDPVEAAVLENRADELALT